MDIIPPSDSKEEFSDSNTNIGYYEPPPFPLDIDSEDLSEDSNDTTNENDDIDGPNSYGLQQTPIVNYSSDYQNEDDYFEGWTWNCFPGQEDSKPAIGPFLGKEQPLFDFTRKEPFHFFNKMFSLNLFDEIASSTNRYAARRLNRTSEYNIYYLFIPSYIYNKCKTPNYSFKRSLFIFWYLINISIHEKLLQKP